MKYRVGISVLGLKLIFKMIGAISRVNTAFQTTCPVSLAIFC
jgi:hypothetical protein